MMINDGMMMEYFQRKQNGLKNSVKKKNKSLVKLIIKNDKDYI